MREATAVDYKAIVISSEINDLPLHHVHKGAVNADRKPTRLQERPSNCEREGNRCTGRESSQSNAHSYQVIRRLAKLSLEELNLLDLVLCPLRSVAQRNHLIMLIQVTQGHIQPKTVLN